MTLLYFKISQWKRWHLKSCRALCILTPTLITPTLPALTASHKSCLVAATPLPIKKFRNILAPHVSNSILKNSFLCSFASFSVVFKPFFINRSKASRDLTIFITSLISRFDIISDVVSHLKISINSRVCCWCCCCWSYSVWQYHFGQLSFT